MFDSRKFGAFISKLRKDSDLSQSSLAEQLNISQQLISQYENGETFPDVTVLIKLSEIFKITLDDIMAEIVNVAPYLKPSLLEKVAEGFKKHDIDISNLVALAEYMNDKSVAMLLEKTTFDTLDENMLEKFVPFLDDESKYKIFEKVLNGELNYNFIKIILPYTNEYMVSQIEAAVVYGVLDKSALDILNEYQLEKTEKEKNKKR